MKRPSRISLHWVIHTSSIGHGVGAFVTSQSPDGGEFVLTVATIATLTKICRMYGVSWTKTMIMSFAKREIAKRLGIKVADHVIRWTPIAGNTVHGFVSCGVTEGVCWALVNELDKLVGKD